MTTAEQWGKWSISPDQGGYNPHPAMGAYSSPYCSILITLTGVPDCLPSSNPIHQVYSIKDELFVDQVTGEIYKYDYDNMLFLSLGEIDHNATYRMVHSLLSDQLLPH